MTSSQRCALGAATLALLTCCGSAPPPAPEHAAIDAGPPLDRDHDGLAEADDVCPCEPEDVDGWQDDDGCPDPDNDGDHVPDPCDVCLNEPETYDGNCDGDGCPDGRTGVDLRISRIVITPRISFAPRSARVRAESTAVLDEVGRVMLENPQIELVALVGSIAPGEGRIDGLALARATAVRDALVERGVAPSRLVVEAASDDADVDADAARAVRFVVRTMNGIAVDDETMAPAPPPEPPRPECEVPVCDPPAPVRAC